MSWTDLRLRLLALFRRRRVEQELDEELLFHVEMQTRKNLAAGMDPASARRAAVLEFGGLEGAREECRDQRGLSFLDSSAHDVRYAVRMLIRRPALTVAVTAILALGIGATTSIFSFVYGVLLRPYPYPRPESLVQVLTRDLNRPERRAGLSIPDIDDVARESRMLEAVGGHICFDTNLANDGPARVVVVCWVTPALFGVAGVPPLLGRTFVPEDDSLGGDPHKLILSHHVWRDMFGSDPAVIGRRVRMRLLSYTIVGVMPAGYQFPFRTDIWCPAQSWLSKFEGAPRRLDRGWTFGTVGRLAPHATIDAAGRELDALSARIAGDVAGVDRNRRFAVRSLRAAETSEWKPYLTLLSVAVACVLLVCCANVAGLLLARGVSRTRELAVRAAIGATWQRLVRQLITESVVLAALGGVLGAVVALLSTRVLMALVPVERPAWLKIETSLAVLPFALGLAAAAGLLFGLAPALAAARAEIQAGLRYGSGHAPAAGRLRKGLIISEVALSLLLLVVSGLMLKTFLLMYTSAPGFTTERALTAFVSPHRVGRPPEIIQAYADIYSRTLAALVSTPGIEAAGGTTTLPYAEVDREGPRSSQRVRRAGDGMEDAPALPIWQAAVSPGYFAAMGIPLREGRDFAESDTAERECAVVISERGTRRLWPERGALGQSVQFPPGEAQPWCRVVGVVGNVRYRGSEGDDGVEIYRSYRQQEAGSFFLVARTRSDPLAYADAFASAAAAGDRDMGVTRIKTLESLIGDSLWKRRMWGFVLSAFAALALVLAAIGLYGVLAYGVSRRTKEIGIRLALGAPRREVVTMVFREAAAMVGVGTVLGLVAALAAGKALAGLLYRVSPYDVSVLLSTPMLLAAVATAACYIPARRAASIDAALAVRSEE